MDTHTKHIIHHTNEKIRDAHNYSMSHITPVSISIILAKPSILIVVEDTSDNFKLLVKYAKQNNVIEIKKLLEVEPTLVNSTNGVCINKIGETALHWASKRNNCEAIKILIRNNADMYAKNIVLR